MHRLDAPPGGALSLVALGADPTHAVARLTISARPPASEPDPHERGSTVTIDTQTFAVVGASLAGAKAAQTLREEGFDGRVVLVGAEPERPYERPPLSKEYLRGEADREKVFVHHPSFYADNEIELRA